MNDEWQLIQEGEHVTVCDGDSALQWRDDAGKPTWRIRPRNSSGVTPSHSQSQVATIETTPLIYPWKEHGKKGLVLNVKTQAFAWAYFNANRAFAVWSLLSCKPNLEKAGMEVVWFKQV